MNNGHMTKQPQKPTLTKRAAKTGIWITVHAVGNNALRLGSNLSMT